MAEFKEYPGYGRINVESVEQEWECPSCKTVYPAPIKTEQVWCSNSECMTGPVGNKGLRPMVLIWEVGSDERR